MNAKLLTHGFAVLTAFELAFGCWASGIAAPVAGFAGEIGGMVEAAGKPVAGATVTLYAAGTGAPTKLAESKSDNRGAFQLNGKKAPADSVLYVVAKGPNDVPALLSVLGSTPPKA